MRENILFIILIFVAFGVAWFVRGSVDRKEFNRRLFEAPSSRTVIVKHDTVYQPERSKKIRNNAPVTKEHQIDADSVYQQGVNAGRDSSRKAFAYYTAPLDTTVQFDSVGSVHVTYRPLERLAMIKLKPSPVRLITVTVTDSIFIKMPEEREWWRTPAYIVGSLAVGWVMHDVLKE